MTVFSKCPFIWEMMNGKAILSVNHKRWIFTHLHSTKLQTVSFCIVLLVYFSFKNVGSRNPTHPFIFFQFLGPYFLMFVSIYSWASQRSENRYGEVFKYLRERMRYFFISKTKLRVLQNMPIPIFRPLRSSRADWHQHQKVGAQKLEKCGGRCVGYRDPKFLNEKNIKRYDAKKTFASWLRLSGWNSTFLIDT